MKCDIIIPVWNNLEFTKDCIESIMHTTDVPYRLVLIDNGSDKETAVYLDSLCERADVTLIRNKENAGFIKAVNQGLRISDAPFICVLNNDTIPASGWLKAMIDFAEEHRDIGLINPQCGGHGAIPIDEYALSLKREKGEYMEMNQCQGFCMLMRREVVDKIGYMDEEFGIGGFDDTDYSMRAYRAGFRCAAIRNAYVYHRQHGSFDKSGDRESWVRKNEKIFFKKWGKPLRFAVALSLYGDYWKDDLKSVVMFCYGLAREWSWIHLSLNFERPLQIEKNAVNEILRSEELRPHQNFKITYSAIPKYLFYLAAAFKLLERMSPRKARKRFNGFLAVDRSLLRRLSFFKKLLRIEFYCVPAGVERHNWQESAKRFAERVRQAIPAV